MRRGLGALDHPQVRAVGPDTTARFNALNGLDTKTGEGDSALASPLPRQINLGRRVERLAGRADDLILSARLHDGIRSGAISVRIVRTSPTNPVTAASRRA